MVKKVSLQKPIDDELVEIAPKTTADAVYISENVTVQDFIDNTYVDIEALQGTVSGLATVASTGDYTDLSNTPSIYTQSDTDELLSAKASIDYVDAAKESMTIRIGRIEEHITDWNDKLDEDDVASVAISGDYNDLINKPSVIINEPNDDVPVNKIRNLTRAEYDDLEEVDENTVYYISDALTTISYDDLEDKPTLFSGDYNDLTNKPSNIINSVGSANSVSKLWVGTETQYNAISTKDSATIYFILE